MYNGLVKYNIEINIIPNFYIKIANLLFIAHSFSKSSNISFILISPLKIKEETSNFYEVSPLYIILDYYFYFHLVLKTHILCDFYHA